MIEFKNGIVLTGSIATGKSTVAALFKMFKFLVIDADKIAHKLLDENFVFVEKNFGKEFVANKKVIRDKLAKLVFNNKDLLTQLENFLHPLIKQAIIKEAKLYEEQNKPYLIDLPLFFEKKNYNIDKIIVVYTPKHIQLQRLMKRDNISKKEALQKISLQIDIENKKQKATFLIDNSKDLNYTIKEVERVKSEILQI
jgi:dephospho-CoA kinase